MTMQGQSAPFAAHVETFDLHGQYEERAAILEYDGGFSRPVAEGLARIEVYGDRARFNRGKSG